MPLYTHCTVHREALFALINGLPTCYEVVSGKVARGGGGAAASKRKAAAASAQRAQKQTKAVSEVGGAGGWARCVWGGGGGWRSVGAREGGTGSRCSFCAFVSILCVRVLAHTHTRRTCTQISFPQTKQEEDDGASAGAAAAAAPAAAAAGAAAGAGGGDQWADGEGDPCPLCSGHYRADEFWIACDRCDRWFCGRCARMTAAKAEKMG